MAAAASSSTSIDEAVAAVEAAARPAARRGARRVRANASPPSAWRATMLRLYERLIAARSRRAAVREDADRWPAERHERNHRNRRLDRHRSRMPAPESYHIEATKSLVDRTLRTLKHDDLFGVFDKQGDCRGGGDGPGRPLSIQDTRFLSGLALRLGGHGAAAARLGGARRQWRAGRRSRQCRSPRRRGQGLAAARYRSMLGRLKFLCGTHLLRADQAAALRSGRAADPARDRVRRRFRRPVRGARRAPAAARHDEASRGSTIARVRFAYVGLDEIDALHDAPFRSAAGPRSTTRYARWDLDLDDGERISHA